jgi:hypothetical protein
VIKELVNFLTMESEAWRPLTSEPGCHQTQFWASSIHLTTCLSKTHYLLQLPSGYYVKYFPTKIWYEFLDPFSDFTTLTNQHDLYKPQSSSLCSILHSTLTALSTISFRFVVICAKCFANRYVGVAVASVMGQSSIFCLCISGGHLSFWINISATFSDIPDLDYHYLFTAA